MVPLQQSSALAPRPLGTMVMASATIPRIAVSLRIAPSRYPRRYLNPFAETSAIPSPVTKFAGGLADENAREIWHQGCARTLDSCEVLPIYKIHGSNFPY